MSDCPNVGIRELLPELLHGALSAPERARVEAHVAGCAECSAELDVLRTVLATTRARPLPPVDVAAIVAVLPRPQVTRPVARSMRPLLRIAAAITFVALGGTSLVVARRAGDLPAVGDTQVVMDSRPTGSGLAPGGVPDSPIASIASPNLTAGGGVSDLPDEDIEALIGALDRLEATPHAEPDAGVFVRVVRGATGGN